MRRIKYLLVLILSCLTLCVGLTACDLLSGGGGGNAHQMHFQPYQAPKCTEEGQVACYYCSHCNAYFADEAGNQRLTELSVPATGHSMGEWNITTQATCVSQGYRTRACVYCRAYSEGEIYTSDEHNLRDWIYAKGVAPTCTEGAFRVRLCKDCNQEIEREEVAPLGHTLGEWTTMSEPTCEQEGYRYQTCITCKKVVNYETPAVVPCKVGRTRTTLQPDCVNVGEEQSYCKWCEREMGTREIPALGHQEKYYPENPATCERDGTTECVACTRCWTVLSGNERLPQIPHNEVTDATVESTCTTDGRTGGSHCSMCLTPITAYTVLPKLGHAEVTDSAVEPTCTTDGKTTGSHCSRCKEVFVPQETVPGGHRYPTEYHKDFTSHWQTCTVCKENGVAAAHTYVNRRCACGRREILEGFEYERLSDGTYKIVDYTGIDGEDVVLALPEQFEGGAVTELGAYALDDLTLSGVFIPSSIKKIEYSSSGAFRDSSCDLYLEDMNAWLQVEIGGSLSNPMHEGKNLYLNDELVTTLTLPSAITQLKAYTFMGCNSLRTLTVPTAVTEMGSRFIWKTANLQELTLPKLYGESSTKESLEYIYSGESLKRVTLLNADVIDAGAFKNNATIEEIVLPDCTARILDEAFYGCSKLKQLIVSESGSLNELGFNVFGGCNALEYLHVPRLYYYDGTNGEVYTHVGYLFGAKTSDGQSSVVPDSLKEIKIATPTVSEYAYYGCSGLEIVTITDEVTSIGKYAFKGCNDIKQFIVDEANTAYCDVGGHLYDRAKTTLIRYAPKNSATAFTVPSTVNRVEEYAFEHATNLHDVTISASVTEVAKMAFYSIADSLYQITFEDVNGWQRHYALGVEDWDVSVPRDNADQLTGLYQGSDFKKTGS